MFLMAINRAYRSILIISMASIIGLSQMVYAKSYFMNGKLVTKAIFECSSGSDGLINQLSIDQINCPAGYNKYYDENLHRYLCTKKGKGCDVFDKSIGKCTTSPMGCAAGQTFKKVPGVFENTLYACLQDRCEDGTDDGNGHCISTDYHYVCPLLPYGWVKNPLQCQPGYEIKWESDSEPVESRRGPHCVPSSKIYKNIPQDIDQYNAKKYLPFYKNWILSGNKCLKKVKVWRCDQGQKVSFQDAVPDGHYFYKKNGKGYACEGNMKFASNIWRERVKEYKTIPKQGNISDPFLKNIRDKITCRSVKAPEEKTVTTNASDSVDIQLLGYEVEEMNFGLSFHTYVKINGKRKTLYSYRQLTIEDIRKAFGGGSKRQITTKQVTPGQFKCVLDYYAPGLSFGAGGPDGIVQGLGSSLHLTGSCAGKYGKDESFDYSKCDQEISIPYTTEWTESCPVGTILNSSINVPHPDVRKINHRYTDVNAFKQAFVNPKRCIYQPKLSHTPNDQIVYDTQNEKYYLKEFIQKEEYWSVSAAKACSKKGYAFDKNKQVCIKKAPDCRSEDAKIIEGKCAYPYLPEKINCPSGYEYKQEMGVCVKNLECEGDATPNLSLGLCVVVPDTKDSSFVIEGYPEVCKVSNVCSEGTQLVYYNGKSFCAKVPRVECPDGYFPLNGDPTKCVATPLCPDGYVEDKENPGFCKMKYHWSLYQCNEGWEGPLVKGQDCDGECMENDCWCNPQNPPANNCKKPGRDPAGYYKVKHKRPLWYHFISGEPFVQENYGKVDHETKCSGKECKEFVTRIEAQGSEICFYKKSGKSACYYVDGCYMKGKIEGRNGGNIPELHVENKNILASKYADGQIVSSCQLNGHMGYTFKKYSMGIMSIGMGAPVKNFANIIADGLVKIDGSTYWQGFNIGAMAIHLSDGNWYVAKDIYDIQGNKVERDLPHFIKTIDNTLFVPISIDGNHTAEEINSGLDCIYHQHKLKEGTCLKAVKIIMPKPDLKIIGIQDLESLKRMHTSKYNNVEINLKLSYRSDDDDNINDIGTIKVHGKPMSEYSISEEVTQRSRGPIGIIDRLDFWNSYQDGFIGFLEFVREVRDEDRIDKYVPEDMFPYLLADKGFSSIYYDEQRGVTILISPFKVDPKICTTANGRVNVASIQDLDFKKMVQFLGGDEAGKSCVIVKTGVKKDFHSIVWAIKTDFYNGNYTFMCSPYICVAGRCKIADCPTGYSGESIPSYAKQEHKSECMAQRCDGNKPYYHFCGKQKDCRVKHPNAVFKDGKCYKVYCDQGVFDSKSNSCLVEKCPDNMHENPDGTCSLFQ